MLGVGPLNCTGCFAGEHVLPRGHVWRACAVTIDDTTDILKKRVPPPRQTTGTSCALSFGIYSIDPRSEAVFGRVSEHVVSATMGLQHELMLPKYQSHPAKESCCLAAVASVGVVAYYSSCASVTSQRRFRVVVST